MAQPTTAAISYNYRSGGSATNGGGFVRGASGTNHTLQDAAEITFTNISSDGAGTLITDDAAGGLLDATHIGNLINIAAGGGFTAGFYEILTVPSSDTFTIERSAGATASSGAGKIGGAIDVPTDALLEGCAGDNEHHWMSGSYSPAAFNVSKSGGVNNAIKIIGYTATHYDACNDDDRPLLAMGANSFIIAGSFWNVRNLRITSTAGPAIRGAGYSRLTNIKANNSYSEAGARHALHFSATYSTFFGCEGISTTGNGFYMPSLETTAIDCVAHGCNSTSDSYGGFYLGNAGSAVIRCIAYDCKNGFNFANNVYTHAVNCVTDGNTVGMLLGASGGNSYTKVFGCQVTSNTDGLKSGSTSQDQMLYLDFNNYYNNTADVTNVAKGDNATANDPGYTDDANGDFSNTSTDISGHPLHGGATDNNSLRGVWQRADGGGSETAYGCVG